MSECCDFDGDYYAKVSASSGEECAQLCREDKICTQFTYIEENGKLQKEFLAILNTIHVLRLRTQYHNTIYENICTGQCLTFFF